MASSSLRFLLASVSSASSCSCFFFSAASRSFDTLFFFHAPIFSLYCIRSISSCFTNGRFSSSDVSRHNLPSIREISVVLRFGFNRLISVLILTEYSRNADGFLLGAVGSYDNWQFVIERHITKDGTIIAKNGIYE